MGQGDQKAIVLGGSGLVGYQVARKLAQRPEFGALVLVARFARETRDAVESLREEFPQTKITGFHGDIFLPGEPIPHDREENRQPFRRDPDLRQRLFSDTYLDFNTAYRDSLLSTLILAEKPNVVVDCVNTATGISYQDVFTSCQTVRSLLDEETLDPQILQEEMETLMVSLSIPQLILHTRILNRAMTEAATRLYLKVGTTGTGGMGLNIPYTHGEERPSPQLLNKTAIAFAHTGMLFLMARTPESPIIKEVKPAALIGYRGVEFRPAMGPQFHRVERDGDVHFELGAVNEPFLLYSPKRVDLGNSLDLTPDASEYELLEAPDGSNELKVPLVDTGENGLFTRGEFEAITALDQMEYITPEEIADIVLLEVIGVGTGRDLVSAVDSSILGSTYKAGLLRPAALAKLTELEEEHGVPSVALGRLGPPGLAKHLFEAYLFQHAFGTLDRVLEEAKTPGAAERVSEMFFALLSEEGGRAALSTSIGIPILCPDGKTLLRGPLVSAPPYRKFRPRVDINPQTLEVFAQTWVDLRPARMAFWLATLTELAERYQTFSRQGTATASVNRAAYLSSEIEIGNVVAWIFSNQDQGFRML